MVEKIAIHCIAQGREAPKPDPEEAARRNADMESLERQGCKVFRIVESDILSDPLDCARTVNRYLSVSRTTTPAPTTTGPRWAPRAH